MNNKIVILTIIITITVTLVTPTTIKLSYAQQIIDPNQQLTPTKEAPTNTTDVLTYNEKINEAIDNATIAVVFGLTTNIAKQVTDQQRDAAEQPLLDCIEQGLKLTSIVGNDDTKQVMFSKTAGNNITKDMTEKLPACYKAEKIGNDIMNENSK